VLSLVCAVQAVAIWMVAARDSHGDGVFDDIDAFSTFLDRKLKTDRDENRNMFDRFFDDRFFSGKKDPFEEMEQMRQQLEGRMDANIRDRFDHSWHEWFGDRFPDDADGVKVQVDESRDAYVYRLEIPNMKDNEFNINIDGSGIDIEGDFSRRVEEKDPEGNVIAKHQMRRTLSKHIALPKDADGREAMIQNKKDKVVIRIPSMPA
jgi:HSP20 family molecular chaperone IbpA